jgi:hypothetical protein
MIAHSDIIHLVLDSFTIVELLKLNAWMRQKRKKK